jgi:hypothetical protein
MNVAGNKRYIGIIGDGGTDREILGRVAKAVLGHGCEIIDLRRQSLRSSVDEYWKMKKDEDGEGAEREIVKSVMGVLIAALDDFERRIPRSILSSDIVIVGLRAAFSTRGSVL